MSAALLMTAAAAVPLLLALCSAAPAARWLPPVATLPALAAALLVPVGTEVSIPWLLLGVHLALDATGQAFLLFSALVWLFAALFLLRANRQQHQSGLYRVFFLTAMGGNFLLILAADMVAFYVGFALMGLAAYPLVLDRSQRARHGGRVYLAFTLLGELALFSAMALLFSASGSLLFSDITGTGVSPLAMALLLFGFGIKVALPGLHGWLPMVYSTAPLVTAAVLSGPMMKAGLLGWLRFVPAGHFGLEFWGELLLVLGVLGVLLGVALGLVQRDARAVLAYSSMAKMGLLSALFGHALAVPALAGPLLAAIVVFALHHLLVKSSLFLAVFEWQRRPARWVLVILALLAASLAAVPLSGGAAAKLVLKDALAGELAWLLSVSGVGTALLMLRFLWLLGTPAASGAGWAPALLLWLPLLPLAFWGPFLPTAVPLSVAGMGPLLASLPLAITGWWLGTRYPGLLPRIPPGDMIYPLLRWLPRSAAFTRHEEFNINWKRVWVRARRLQADPANMALPGMILLLLCLLLLASLLLPLVT